MHFPGIISRHPVRVALSLSVVILLLLHAAGIFQPGFVNYFENSSYDARLNLMTPGTWTSVSCVGIDEKSLQEPA